MSKRVTITEKNASRQEVKIYPKSYTKRGKNYFTYVARWKEDGKPREKQFKDQLKADEFKAEKEMEFLNLGAKQKLTLSTLTEDQTREAERAFKTLGETYSLEEAIKFFLKHNRPPEYSIRLLDGIKGYEDHQEHKGTRAVTIKRSRGILKQFGKHLGNPKTHTVTDEDVKGYLRSLRALDEVSPAKAKTFNNHRAEILSFFLWAAKKDLATNRPWLFHNPCEGIEARSTNEVNEQREATATTSPEMLKELMSYVMSYKGGKLVKWYALAYFAGLRPSTDQGELIKLAENEEQLINLDTMSIRLLRGTSKVKVERSVTISENLKAWLEAYEDFPIAPKNLKNDLRHIRKKFELQHDEPRHSFISYYIAVNRSVGDAAMQAGNSERKINEHYLNLHTREEGQLFFAIQPDVEAGQAVFADTELKTIRSHLKAI